MLGETEILGWQGPRLDLEASGVTGFPVVRERRGAWMTRGFNSVARIESGWTSDHVSLWTQLRLLVSENRETDPTLPKTHATVSGVRRFPETRGRFIRSEWGRANLLLNWKNLLLQAGYDSLRFGSGTRGVLHWDSHSSPMPLLQIGSRGPWETSWGYWTFSHQVVQLEQDRHVPYARLSGWRLGWSSERRFEFGLSRSWQVGWVQGEQYRFYQLVGELYDPSRFSRIARITMIQMRTTAEETTATSSWSPSGASSSPKVGRVFTGNGDAKTMNMISMASAKAGNTHRPRCLAGASSMAPGAIGTRSWNGRTPSSPGTPSLAPQECSAGTTMAFIKMGGPTGE